MSRYSRIFHHINVEDVKRKRQDKILSELWEEERIKEEKEYIAAEMKKWRYDWREDLKEQMTTAGVMSSEVPGEGDTDLATIDAALTASYAVPEGQTVYFQNTGIQPNGPGTWTNGFDVGGDYLGFGFDSGSNPNDPRFAALAPIDSSEYDTIVVKGIRGTDYNGGEDPDEEGAELQVYYQLPGGSMVPLNVNPDGETDSDISTTIIPIGNEDLGLKNWELSIPSYAQAKNTRFILYQRLHSGVYWDNYGITQVYYRRVKPMNVVISLDSPAASSFIRVGQSPTEKTSPKKRKKKVEEILAASRGYTTQQWEADFPGSRTTLSEPTTGPETKIGDAQAAQRGQTAGRMKNTWKQSESAPFGKPENNSRAAFNSWAKAKDAELKRQHHELVTKAGYGWTLGTPERNFQDSTYIQFTNYPPGTPEHALGKAIVALWKSAQDAHNAYGKQIGKGGEKKDFTWDELMARDAAQEDPYGTAWGGEEPTDAEGEAPTDTEEKEPKDIAQELADNPEGLLGDAAKHLTPAGRKEARSIGSRVLGLIDALSGDTLDLDKMGRSSGISPQLTGKSLIALSALQNKPITVDNVPQAQQDKYWSHLTPHQIGSDNITISPRERPYQDGQIIHNADGTVRANDGTVPDRTMYLNPKFSEGGLIGAVTGMGDLGGAGKADHQIVVPGGNMSKAYVVMKDEAYDNRSNQRFGERGLAGPLAAFVNYVGDTIHGRSGDNAPNTGGMVGYPPGINATVRTEIRKPISELPPNIQDAIKKRWKTESILQRRRGTSADEPISTKKKKVEESTFQRIKKWKKKFDYEGKPTPTDDGFPEDPPPKLKNGFHPKYGKQSGRYKRLDPHSAKTMRKVKTGDPETDSLVQKQSK